MTHKRITLPTVDPQQEKALKDLLGGLTDPNNETLQVGDQFATPSGAEGASLAALEERALALGGGEGGQLGDIEQQVNDALSSILKSGGGEVGGDTFEEFFRTNVEDPLSKSFGKEFKDIGRRFGGNNLFGSERRETDRRANEDFFDSLTGARAGLAFAERGDSSQRLLQAIGLGGDLGASRTNQLGQIASAGTASRGLNAQTQLSSLALAEESRQNRINSILNAVRTPLFENIVKGASASSGKGAAAVGAASAIISAIISSSDIRLKENIKRVGETHEGIGLYTWDWKEEALEKYPDHLGETIGVIAQEVIRYHSEVISMDKDGFLLVDYSKLDLSDPDQSLIH